MSFDDKQHMDDDEFDLAELFRSIWFHKFSLLVFLIVSVPLSVMYSTTLTPTYRAETVFEKPRDEGTRDSNSFLNRVEGLGFLSVLGGGSTGRSFDTFYSEIRSASFLKTVILNNANFDSQLLQEFCPLPSKETTRFSLRSLLIALGISENRAPSESQKESLLVECVNGMLEIDFDTYDSNESSAYRLSIESADPNFSAYLANQIVEKYFVFHEKKRDQEFQKVKEYLSRIISEAQREFITANKSLQSFIIRHTFLMNIEPPAIDQSSDDKLPRAASPFAAKLKKDFFSLSQLENSLSKLNKARLKLSNLKDVEKYKTYEDISATEIQDVFSRAFITAISKMDNLSAGSSVINKEITKIVGQELMSLRQQIQVLEEKINKREEQTMQLMTIENRFQELSIDVSKKKFIFEGLKDQLKEKIISSGFSRLGQPALLTKAVPPFSEASPNKKLIIALGAIISMLLGIAYILIRQTRLRRVHSLSQLKRISKSLSCFAIKYKQLNYMGQRSDETVIGQSFFSHTIGGGKLGCIIDLSKKLNEISISSEFSKAIANLLAADNSKIVCLDSSPSKSSFFASSPKNFESNLSDHNPKGFLSKGTLAFIDEEGMLSAGEVKEIKNKYSDYDKIVCALGAEIGDLTKFKFMEQCDFYILIGRSSHFDEYDYRKFSNTVWEKEKKCLGFFMID